MNPTTKAFVTAFSEGMKIGNNQQNILDDAFYAGFNIGSNLEDGIEIDQDKLKMAFYNGILIETESDQVDKDILSCFQSGYRIGINQKKKNQDIPKENKLFVWNNVKELDNGTISVMATDLKSALEIVNKHWCMSTDISRSLSLKPYFCIRDKGLSWTTNSQLSGCYEFMTDTRNVE